MVELNFSQIVDDHHATCGSGYMTAVCPTGVCGPTQTTATPATAQPAEASTGSALANWRRARLAQIERAL